MSGCTAPVRGHRTSGGTENCPVCRYRSNRYSYRPTYTPPPAPPVYRSRVGSGGGGGGGGSTGRARPAWQPSKSTVIYTPQQVRNLEPVRVAVETRTQAHDVFLCHAWPDRQEDATDVYDLLVGKRVSVWFSEASLRLGTDMRAAIDRGLASSRVGIVLVTPAMLDKLRTDRSIASSELSALLRRNLLIPVLHGVRFEELDLVSPLLASKGGLSTAEESMDSIAQKIAELVGVLNDEEAEALSVA